MKARFVYKGGEGSGFHGHAGRPGEVGGSQAEPGVSMSADDYTKKSAQQVENASLLQFAAVRAYTRWPTVNELLRGHRRYPKKESYQYKGDNEQLYGTAVDDEAYWKYWREHNGSFPDTYNQTKSGIPDKLDITSQGQIDYIEKHGWKRTDGPMEVGITETEIIKQIDGAMTPLEEDMVVYRGSIGTEDWTMKQGTVFEDKGFVSTTVNFDVTKNFGVDFFELHIPKGTKAVFADEFSIVFPEDDGITLKEPMYRTIGEVLLERGLNYKYVGTNTVNGQTVDVFEVGPAGSFGKSPSKSLSPKVSQTKYKSADRDDKDMSRFVWKFADIKIVS